MRENAKSDKRPMMSLWGAEARPSESETQYLDSVCLNSGAEIPLPLQMGEYDVTRILGRGGMGVVFEGEHRRMQRRVAIKVLSSQCAETPSIQQQFLSEIRVVARLLHPRIVTAFDAGQFGSVVYLVMEYVEGLSMAELVAAEGPQSVALSLNFIQQAAEGLAHAHLNSVIHRDVKPGNLMVSKDGSVKLLDLGLATLAQDLSDEQSPQRRMICGTPEFMPIEQFEGGDLTESVDVYALGCTLFHLLTGRPPYRGKLFELQRAHAAAPIPKLADFGLTSHRKVQQLLDRMLAKQSRDRISSMDDVISAIKQIHGDSAALPATAVIASSQISDSSLSFEALPPTFVEQREVSLAIDLGGHFLAASTQSYDTSSTPHWFKTGNNVGLLHALVASSKTRTAVFGAEASKRLPFAIAQGQCAAELVKSGESIRFGDQVLTATSNLALLLDFARRDVERGMRERNLPADPISVLLTVPSCFTQVMRERIASSIGLAGFSTGRFVDRNIASVLSQFNIENTNTRPNVLYPQGYWLVLSISDLSMEVALMAVSPRRVQMLSVAGDTDSGEPRWVRRMSRWIRRKTAAIDSSSASGSGDSQKLILHHRISEAVSNLLAVESVPLKLSVGARTAKTTIGSEMIVSTCADLVQNFGELLAMVLSEAGIDGEEISCCLSIGSLAQIAPVRNLLKNFGITAAVVPVSQADLALGASNMATIKRLPANFQPKLIPCNAHDLGIQFGPAEVADVSLLIPRLTSLPARVNRTLPCNEMKAQQVTLAEMTSLTDTKWVAFEQFNVEANKPGPHDSVFEVGDDGRVQCQVSHATTKRGELAAPNQTELKTIQNILLRLRIS